MKKLMIVAIIAVMALAQIANAGTARLELSRSTLINVDDAAGRWQHEGGKVYKTSGTTLIQVGYYSVVRRVTNGGTTAPLNTAAVTMTIYFALTQPSSAAPNNITIQGAHNYNSGYLSGSVSAASSRYSWLRDANVTANHGNTGYVLFDWNGASQLTLP